MRAVGIGGLRWGLEFFNIGEFWIRFLRKCRIFNNLKEKGILCN